MTNQCVYCRRKISGGKDELQRHINVYCANFPTKCEYCLKIGTRLHHRTYHGDHCIQRTKRCQFCEKKMPIITFGKHLCMCEALDKRLLEKHNLVCDTVNKSSWIELLDNILKCPWKKYVIRDFLQTEDALPISNRIKLLYCFSNCGVFEKMLRAGSPETPFVNSFAEMIFTNISLKLFPEIKFIMGRNFSKYHFVELCRIHSVVCHITEDVILYSFPMSKQFWIISTMDIGTCCYQFVDDKMEAQRYFDMIHEMLDATRMNVYVNKIIKDYYYCDVL